MDRTIISIGKKISIEWKKKLKRIESCRMRTRLALWLTFAIEWKNTKYCFGLACKCEIHNTRVEVEVQYEHCPLQIQSKVSFDNNQHNHYKRLWCSGSFVNDSYDSWVLQTTSIHCWSIEVFISFVVRLSSGKRFKIKAIK